VGGAEQVDAAQFVPSKFRWEPGRHCSGMAGRPPSWKAGWLIRSPRQRSRATCAETRGCCCQVADQTTKPSDRATKRPDVLT